MLFTLLSVRFADEVEEVVVATAVAFPTRIKVADSLQHRSTEADMLILKSVVLLPNI